jgi:Na+/H+-translocating membrane pyrophosphatase
LGAFTSLLSGFIGMYVATTANSRVTFYAARHSDPDTAYKKAFCVAYEGGCVMGFCLVSLALFVLLSIIYFYKSKNFFVY